VQDYKIMVFCKITALATAVKHILAKNMDNAGKKFILMVFKNPIIILHQNKYKVIKQTN